MRERKQARKKKMENWDYNTKLRILKSYYLRGAQSMI